MEKMPVVDGIHHMSNTGIQKRISGTLVTVDLVTHIFADELGNTFPEPLHAAIGTVNGFGRTSQGMRDASYRKRRRAAFQ